MSRTTYAALDRGREEFMLDGARCLSLMKHVRDCISRIDNNIVSDQLIRYIKINTNSLCFKLIQ